MLNHIHIKRLVSYKTREMGVETHLPSFKVLCFCLSMVGCLLGNQSVAQAAKDVSTVSFDPVSYTHLTLPTILLV